jgi:hypothetical protein
MTDTPRTDALPDYMDATALRAAHSEMERMLVSVTRENDKAQEMLAEIRRVIALGKDDGSVGRVARRAIAQEGKPCA